MARNFDAESEFGLGILPDPFGEPIAEDATGPGLITGLTDADAIKAGAGTGTLFTLGAELREIYAQGDGTFGTEG